MDTATALALIALSPAKDRAPIDSALSKVISIYPRLGFSNLSVVMAYDKYLASELWELISTREVRGSSDSNVHDDAFDLIQGAILRATFGYAPDET